MSNNPTQKPEWKDLAAHAAEIKKQHLNDLFSNDMSRFDNFSVEIDGLFFDYSKQRIISKIQQKLCALLSACNFDQKRTALFDGSPLNTTENRAALHTALRRPKTDVVAVNGTNILPEIHATLDKMKSFSEDIRNARYKGATGKPITQIISIGVGGSDLGPRMVCEALKPSGETIETYFISNIDADDITGALNKCNPETTLFIIASKSFATQETLTNAKTAKNWLIQNLPKGSDISAHLVAVSTNLKATAEFGISQDNFFPMWEWVNGRFSLWSAVGLPICLQLGFDHFQALLNGAYKIDRHFQTAPLEKNIPVLMALIGIWNRNFLNFSHHAILPYAQRLFYLPAYLQQLEMESNGKTIDLEGDQITDYKTNPIVFGEVGTNGQHSFYQLLHQGSETIPCDFIAAIRSNNGLKNHHDLLLNNMLAQGQALMLGKQNTKSDEPFRYFSGNKPSSTLFLDKLDARHLGMLIALYEHKCFVQGIIWNINSFDQFGVELGKTLSRKIEKNDLDDADSSTRGLFSLIHKSGK